MEVYDERNNNKKFYASQFVMGDGIGVDAKHKHRHHHHHHHYHDGYAVIYNQPRGYYNQAYYPQPIYYPAPAPVYAPPPVYAYPPNVMFDISTDIGHFMFRH